MQSQSSSTPTAAAGLVILAVAFLIFTSIGFRGSVHF